MIVGVLFLPTALFVAQYPVPTPWATCGSDCPSNAFQVTGSEPGFFDAFIGPLQQATTALIYAGVALALALRLARGSRLTREALLPVLGTAILRMAFAAAFIVARRRSPDSQLTEALGLVALACIPAFSAAFVIGLLRAKLIAGRALMRLGARYGSEPHGRAVRDAIADAVGDPSLEVIYWNSEDSGGWIDAAGEPVDLPSLGPDRVVTEVRGRGGRVAILVHDRALTDAPVITEVAGGFALIALENQRLETQLRSSLRELRSRADGSCRPPTSNVGASSATFTTARSSDSCRSGSSWSSRATSWRLIPSAPPGACASSAARSTTRWTRCGRSRVAWCPRYSLNAVSWTRSATLRMEAT